MKNQELRYFLYARRSKEQNDKEENVASIESQISEMRKVADREGLKVVKIFKETKSAKRPYIRPVFQEMVSQIQLGKADAILVWKIDRLARNSVDEGLVKYLLQEGIVKNIRASDRNWFPDDNVLMASVEFGVANQYSRDLSKHVKRGLTAKVEAGYRPSLAPLGYLNSLYREKGKEEILVDKERFPLVRKLFDEMLTGKYSRLELLNVAEKIGLTMRPFRNSPTKKMSKTNIYHLVTNSFYYGEFDYPQGSGNWYHGNHEPMISKEEYDRIQTLLGREGKPRRLTHKFTYGGCLLKCGGCGASITAELKIKKQLNGNVHIYTYYHCTRKINRACCEKSIEEKELTKQVSSYLQEIEIPQLLHEWSLATLKDMFESEKKDRNTLLNQKHNEYKDRVSKIDKLMDLKLDGLISDTNFKTKLRSLETERDQTKKFIDEIDSRIGSWFKKAEEAFDFAETAKKEFDEGSPEKKRDIVSSLGYNLFLKDRKLNIEWPKLFLVLKKMNSEARGISNRLEPPKSVDKQQQIKQKYTQNPLLCGMGESDSRLRFGKPSFYH